MDLQTIDGAPLTVSDTVFARPYSEALVHQVLVAYQAAGRSGTKAQKSRADVRGTTKKFKKQKGGGARHGDYRAPIFVGGGVTFAANPRSFEQKVNRKMYRGAMQAIFSELARQGRLRVINGLSPLTAKTKSMVGLLSGFGVENALIISEEVSNEMYLSSRNLPYVSVVDVSGVDPVSLVRAKNVLITSAAVKKVEEWLS